MTPVTPVIAPNLQQLGFGPVTPSKGYRLQVSIAGTEKSGKTTWAFTAPGPIAAISTDTGTEEIARGLDPVSGRPFMDIKEIIICHFKSPAELQQQGKQKTYEEEWKRMKDAILAIIASRRYRTLIVDTGTEAWELCRLAAFGKLTQVMPHHYVAVNSEFKSLVKSAFDDPKFNTVWIHKMKKEYKTMNGKDSWSGRFERAGFGDMPFLVDCNLVSYFRPRVVDHLGETITPPAFGIEIVDTRANMQDRQGEKLEGKLNNFEQLGIELYPATYLTKEWR